MVNVSTASAADPTTDNHDNDLVAGQQENPVKIMAPSVSETEQLDDDKSSMLQPTSLER